MSLAGWSPTRAARRCEWPRRRSTPHVTYFLNGGEEEPYRGEDRIMVPSPKVATYDLKPEMSAPELTDRGGGSDRLRSI